jgi:hypothetical protein
MNGNAMKTTLAALAMTAALSGAAWAQQGNPGQHFLEQWDADSDGSVTPAEVAAKRSEVFAMFDQDEDQTLSAAEWALVADHMSMEMGQGMDGQGQGMGQGMGHGSGQGMRMGKGKGMGKGMGMGGMAGPGQAVHEGMTPAFNDADGDGIVTLAEFDAASVKLFPLMDADGDGAVTAADFAH